MKNWKHVCKIYILLFTLYTGISVHVHVADIAVVDMDVLNNIGLTILAEVAAAKKKLMK
jgi:Na+/alanine symporter